MSQSDTKKEEKKHITINWSAVLTETQMDEWPIESCIMANLFDVKDIIVIRELKHYLKCRSKNN